MPGLHRFAPNIAIIGFGQDGLLSITKWLEPFGLNANEVGLGNNRGIEPWVTTARPGKTHLPFDLDRYCGPIDVVEARESRKQSGSFNKPTETVRRQSGAAFWICKFARGQFVAASSI
ncbi:hypothetical protein M527_05780 [Sphingobium indicum IP26]|uniref:Uncharacterized protein n=1 Tax=Sphingobium indicum F2 TaxID=1450518 RepID=A0A8E1C4G6_9SPHN|nr:hypothetical protein M527_05780 [Sphingobium indicum IP26]KER38330.1 hypothetical protein AL00_01020 [Sphingobium indicum F2]